MTDNVRADLQCWTLLESRETEWSLRAHKSYLCVNKINFELVEARENCGKYSESLCLGWGTRIMLGPKFAIPQRLKISKAKWAWKD